MTCKTCRKDVTDTSTAFQESLSTLSKEMKNTSKSLRDSVALTSGIGDVVSSSLNIPIITSFGDITSRGAPYAPIVVSIEGVGFGSKAGKLLVVEFTGASADLRSPVIDLTLNSDSVEVPGQQLSWSDAAISWNGADVFMMGKFKDAFNNQPHNILFQVISASGSKSNVFALPQAPSSLRAIVN